MTLLKSTALGLIIGLSLGTAPAQAGHHGNHPPQQQSLHAMSAHNIELRNYMDYEHREQCQNYRPVPRGFYRSDWCTLSFIGAPAPSSNVLVTYEINFDFDSVALGDRAQATLEKIAQEIKMYNPSEVTVEGYTDTSGTAAYNLRLSQQRASVASEALNSRDITNRILETRYHGENELAVETGDGVKLRENRRVTVRFMK